MDLILKNAKGEELNLLHNQYFVVKSVEALHGTALSYSETESPYIDGSDVNNVRAMPRGILFTLVLIGDISASRDAITAFAKSKQAASLREVTEKRDITIKGFLRVPTYTRMMRQSTMQVELYCNRPYWSDTAQMIEEIGERIRMLYFPIGGVPFGIITDDSPAPIGRVFGVINIDREKTIVNDGDAETGMVIEIVATGTVKNPKISCSTGSQNGWSMAVAATMQQNDIITIDTTAGQKSIKYNGGDTYGGVPILSLLSFVGDDWLQLEVGTNTFNVESDGDFNAYFDIKFKRVFE